MRPGRRFSFQYWSDAAGDDLRHMLMTKSDLGHVHGLADVWDQRTGEWKVGHGTFHKHLIGEVEERDLRPEGRLPRAYRVRVPGLVAAGVAARARPPQHNTGLPDTDAAPAGAAPALARAAPAPAASAHVAGPTPPVGPVTRGRAARLHAPAGINDSF